MVDIQELKHKHYKIKEVIKNHIRRGTDYKEKFKEYLDIVDELKSNGVEVNDTSAYIQQAIERYQTKQNKPSYQPVIQDPIETTPRESVFQISLAWTERPNKNIDDTVTILENYLLENGATSIGSNDFEFDDYTEHIREYEWTGGDNEFNILRKSANYILDVFAQNQYEKFNVSMFGHKK